MKSLESVIQQIKTEPEKIEFSDIISTVENNYQYQATRFTNGIEADCVTNEAGENEGSCKIFAFAKINQLDQQQTLHCFGQYYRDDVLNHPEGNDHANIRTFMKYGWEGINFDNNALEI